MKVLFVLTSHDKLSDTGKPTGFWLEEFTTPYYKLEENGVEIEIASPKGGQPPIDPKSDDKDSQTESIMHYFRDAALKEKLAHTRKLSEVKAEDYDAVFYPGGHGPLWDLANDEDSAALIEAFAEQNKPVVAVCHGPAALTSAKTTDGEPFIKGKKVTSFSNTEEATAELTDVVPFLIEDKLKEQGGTYFKSNDWAPYVVKDGLLITGQNPASSGPAAEELLKLLKK